MFTGIVEELGEVVASQPPEDRPQPTGSVATRLTLRGPTVVDGARHGDSISVNGVCLTVVDTADGTFSADVVAETWSRTSLRTLTVGSRVNLERPMALGERLGGHLVQGHVDGTGTIERRDGGAAGEVVQVGVPGALTRYIVAKGSITVDGVSLTVVEAGAHHLTVSLIPATLELTTLGIKGVGDPVNLEVDVLAKYVERLLATDGAEAVR